MKSDNIGVLGLGRKLPLGGVGDGGSGLLSSQEGAWLQGFCRDASIPCRDGEDRKTANLENLRHAFHSGGYLQCRAQG